MRATLLGGAIVLIAGLGLPAAQTEHSTTGTYDLDIPDVNGGPMPGLSSSYSQTDGSKRVIETRRSLNGQSVPAERVEERVVSDEGGVRVVERQVVRYDPNGNPLPREKQVITTTKRADGSVDERLEDWRGDINGNLALAQRTDTETRKSGSTMTSETAIAKPSLNDSVDVVEKRDVVRTEGADGAYRQNETVYRNGQSGFYEAVRRVTDHREDARGSSENTAEYEVGNTGELVLNSQTVSKTVKAPNGSETIEITRLDRSAPGTVISGDDPGLKLRSQEIVERATGPGGSVHETVSVRRPTISNPDQLGPAKEVSETVCRGDCSHP
jgi:hypothetical protein